MAEEKLNPAGFPPIVEPPTEGSAAEDSGRRTRFRLIILGVVLALAVGYMIYAAFPGNALYFLTVSEFMGGAEYQDGRVLRVSGKLAPDSFQREGDGTLAYFRLVDKELADNAGAGAAVVAAGPSLRASYVGVMPDLFFNPHSEIILEGSYSAEGVFQTDNILVKCPSKYQSLEDEPPADYNSPGYSSEYTPAAGA